MRTTAHEFRILTRAGEIRWVMETVTPITYKGRPAIFGHFMDITDRKAMEEKIRESETLYRTIFETTGTATIIIEEDTTVSLVNSEFERLYGAPKQYWEGKRSWLEFAAEKERDRMLQYHNLRRMDPKAAPGRYEFRFVDRKGNVKNVLVTISMIPGTGRSVSSHADITELKRQEKALRRREREIEAKSRNLEEMNTALKVLLKQRESDQSEMEDRVLANIKHLVIPYLGKLKTGRLGDKERAFVNVLESNLMSIISPFSQRLTSKVPEPHAQGAAGGYPRQGRTDEQGDRGTDGRLAGNRRPLPEPHPEKAHRQRQEGEPPDISCLAELTVYFSYTVCLQSYHIAFAPDLPYTVPRHRTSGCPSASKACLRRLSRRVRVSPGLASRR